MPILAFLVLAQPDPGQHMMPVYVGASEAIVRAMGTALVGLDHRVVKITSEEGSTTIELLGKKVREDQLKVVWAFDGKNIYVRDKAKHVFVTGHCLRHRAVEIVSKVTGTRVDPVTRALLFKRVPLEEGLVDSTVRVVGFVAPNGVPCDIVQADSKLVKTTFFVRRSDHLPQSVSTENLIGGKGVSSTTRQFEYSTLVKPDFVLSKSSTEKLGTFPKLQIEKI